MYNYNIHFGTHKSRHEAIIFWMCLSVITETSQCQWLTGFSIGIIPMVKNISIGIKIEDYTWWQ